MLLFVFAVVSSIFLTQSSVTAALGKDDFLLTVYPDEVKGLKEVQHNFTLGLKCLTKECFGKIVFVFLQSMFSLKCRVSGESGGPGSLPQRVFVDSTSSHFEFIPSSRDQSGDTFVLLDKNGGNQTIYLNASMLGKGKLYNELLCSIL